MRNIDNPLNVKVERREIYTNIYEYTIPEGYYFESCGTSYGNTIYGREMLDNFYVIKKKDETNTSKDSQ